MPPLTISTASVPASGGAATVVRLAGSADLANEAILEREMTRLMASRPPLVVLDLSALTFLASLAVGQFVALARALRGTGELRTAAPQPGVRLVLERCKVADVLNLRDTLESALTSPDAPRG